MSSLPLIYFERLLEDCPDIIVAVDHDGKIIFYNDGARTALGYHREDILGRHVSICYPSLDEARAVMRAMRDPAIDAPGRVKNFQTTFVTRTGGRLAVAISGSLIHDEAGREIGSIGFAKDLGEIHRQDQLATLAEIAVGVAHEVNNPLAAIGNNLKLLSDALTPLLPDGSPDPAFDIQLERIESMDASLERIRSIVHRLAEMSGTGEYDTREYLPGTLMADLRSRAGTVAPAARRVPAGALAGLHVLVADDDLAVCQSVSELMRAEGCEVVTAANGSEALAALDRARFDLVLSDVVMPDTDGYDLFLACRERHPDVPVVLMTAFYHDRDHVLKRSKIAGLDGILFKKPVDPARLLEIAGERTGRYVPPAPAAPSSAAAEASPASSPEPVSPSRSGTPPPPGGRPV